MLFHVALAASTVLEPFPSGRQIVLPVLDLDKKTHVLHTVAKSANELRFSLSAIVSATVYVKRHVGVGVGVGEIGNSNTKNAEVPSG